MSELDTSKRKFLKTAAYVAPVVLTLNASASFAGVGSPDCVGNPGNDKCVGNAGETPNGEVSGWVPEPGTRGMSQHDD